MNRYLTLKIVFTFQLLFLFSSLYSQEKFINGFVVQLNGDTLKGLIDYRNWGVNPKLIRFRTNNNETFKYTPRDIKAFGVLDEIYKGAIVKVDNSNLKKMSDTPLFEFRTDTVFLQTLFDGSKCLYYYKDVYDQENFYIENNTRLELLEYKTYTKIDIMGHRLLMQNKRYVGQLRLYLNDYPEIDEKLKGLEYNKKSMHAVFNYYYNHQKNEKYFTRQNEKLTIEIGILVGASMIDLSFKTSGVAFEPLPKAKFANTFSPTFGVFANIVKPRNDGRWSLCNELIYSKYSTTAIYNDFHSNDNYQIHHYSVDFTYGKINSMLRYKYPIAKFKIFADAGFSFGLIVNEKNSDNINRQYNGTNTWYKENIIINSSINFPFVSKKYELGALLGVGLNYKNVFLELRYEAGTGFTPFPALQINANRLFLLLAYKF